jgi:hypothetical protein
MLLVGIRSYLKSVLRYKFFILDTYHPDTLYMSMDVKICGYFSKPKGVGEQKRLRNTVQERCGGAYLLGFGIKLAL